MPIATGNFSDSLEALVDGKCVTLRVPYPMGFHAKGLDGRIDDPERRLEGQGPVVGLCRPRALAHRRRQGQRPQGGEIPAASRSAGAVMLDASTLPAADSQYLSPADRHRAADHAGQAERDLAGGGGADAAERQRADADLAPVRRRARDPGPLRRNSSIEAIASLRRRAVSTVSAASMTSLSGAAICFGGSRAAPA